LYNTRTNATGHASPISAEPRAGVSTEAAEGWYVVSIGEHIQVIRRRLWVILLVASILVGAALGFDYAQTPKYEASIRVLIGQKQLGTAPGTLGNDVQGLQQLTQTMVEAAHSHRLAEAVIRQENLRMSPRIFLKDYMDAEQLAATQFIKLSYKDPSPQKARQVANTIGGVFSDQVSDVSPSANSVTATVWEPAVSTYKPVSPNFVRDCLLALVIGLTLGVGLAFLLEHLDDSWRTPEEVEQVSALPNLGVIPEFRINQGKKNDLTRASKVSRPPPTSEA
jgi:capsular polysaccharide biosynthesis protein